VVLLNLALWAGCGIIVKNESRFKLESGPSDA
jgi:hypothetical protein